jgi:cytoskeletal protein CcmA (bactofilin family)
MDRISRSACAFGLVFLALGWASPNDASAAVLRHAKNFVLPGAETIHDDLYAAGSVVDIQGTVDGDLVVAGQTVTIGGFVTGDVIAAARDVTISGSVGGTVRAAGNVVTIDGTVGHDVVAACGTLVIGPHASVGRDVLAGAGNSSFGGRISRDVMAGARSVTFSGSIGGNVHAHSKEIHLTDGAVLERDLIYTSRNALVKSPGATVRGRTEQRMPEEREGGKGPFSGSPVLRWLQGLVGLLILGLLFFLLTGAGQRTLEALQRAPWPSLGLGVLLAFGVPFAAAFLFFLGLFFGGWWIALGALVLYFFALALGYVVTATQVGRWILARAGRGGSGFGWALLVGLAALGLVTVIPYLGKLVGLCAALLGLGALALAWYRGRRGVSATQTAPTPAT